MPRNVKLNEQMRAETRQKILTTATDLFSQQGFFNVRIAEIAARASMSPGNIYWYFTSKEEILKAILEGLFQAYDQMLIQAATYPGSGLEKIRRLIELQILMLEDHGQHMNIFMSILGHDKPVLMQKLGFDTVRIGLGFHQHIRSIFEAAIQEGVLPSQPPDALAVLYFSFFNGLLITYGEEWKRMVSPDLITTAVLRLLGFQIEAS